MPRSIETRVTRRQLRQLGQKIERSANRRAVNRGATAARAESLRIIKKELSLPARFTRPRVRKTNARGRRTTARLFFPAKPIRLIHFAARRIRPGVSYRIGGRRVTIRGAFIARQQGNGLPGVFIRQRRGGQRVGRLPIRQLTGPGVGAPFAGRNKRRNLARVQKVYVERYRTTLRQELAFRR